MLREGRRWSPRGARPCDPVRPRLQAHRKRTRAPQRSLRRAASVASVQSHLRPGFQM